MAFEHDIAHITAKIDIELPNGKKSIGNRIFLSRSI